MNLSGARLLLLAALLVLPLSDAADVLSTHPPFAKCDPAILAGLKFKNSIFPVKNVYETLVAQETWTLVRSSYAFKMSSSKCVTFVIKDDWFNATIVSKNGSNSSYTLNYTIEVVDGGIEGHTIPFEPRRSWRMEPIVTGDEVQSHYVCNKEYGSTDTPPHADIVVAKNAMNNYYKLISPLKFRVDLLSGLMKPFFTFTFESAEECTRE